jgi:hypothetical protein
MKSASFITLVVLLTLPLIVGSSFAKPGATPAGNKTVYTGVVGDTMCGTKHMQDTKEADCIHMCIEHGFDYALVVGDKIYTLKGDKNQIDKLSGRKVKVTGSLTGNAITVESIELLESK